MSLVVLLILAVVWAVFLVPQLVRARAERTPADSIGAFRSQLSVLERTAPGVQSAPSRASARPVLGGAYTAPVTGYRPVGALPTRSQVRKRRKDILQAMLGSIAFSVLVGVFFRPMWMVAGVLVALTAAYCFALVRARNIAAEREMKVRYLPGPAAYSAVGEPAVVGLRRSGS